MSKWTEVPSGQTNGAFQRFMGALGDKAEVATERINTEPVFADRLAAFAINGGVEPTTSQKRAREIIGKNFFGIEESVKHFGINPDRRQIASLSEIPWTEEELKRDKDTHVLVAVFPISILEIREVAEKFKMPNGQRLMAKQDWYDKESPAKNPGETGWHLVLKTEVADSLSKSWTNQLKILGEENEVSTIQIMTYTVVGHFMATGERLFPKIWVRTSSVGSGGVRFFLGFFGDVGLRLYDYWDDSPDGSVGLSCARK